MEPYIVVIEGTDGCGKKTQTDLLFKWAKEQNLNVIRQSFPNYDSKSAAPVQMMLNGELGDSADSLDAYQASTLYATDRLCTLTQIKQNHKDCDVILFDRYVESNMLYQAGKIHDEKSRDVFLDWLCDFEFNKLKLPRANKVIFLDMPVEKSMELARNRGELKAGTSKDIYEQDVNFMKQTYNAGKSVAQKFGWDIVPCVDKNGNLKTIETIHNEIKKLCGTQILVATEQNKQNAKKLNENIKI